MKRLLMLCDADIATGETFQPLLVSALCTVTKKIEPAGRSFLDTYETRVAPKHHRRKCSCKLFRYRDRRPFPDEPCFGAQRSV